MTLARLSAAVALVLGLLDTAAAAPAADVAAFVPDGWTLVSRLDEDLTGDRRADPVLVIANEDAERRVLVLIAADKSLLLAGSMTVETQEPPQLSARRGVLVVDSTLGGATLVVEQKQRFRFHNVTGKMRLIGVDVSRYSRTQQTDQVELSINALTGDREVKVSKVIDEKPDGTEIPWEEREYAKPQTRKDRIAKPDWTMEQAPDAFELLDAATVAP